MNKVFYEHMKRNILLIFLVAAVLPYAVSCTKMDLSNDSSKIIAGDPVYSQEGLINVPDNLQSVNWAVNSFTFELYKEIYAQTGGESMVVAPFAAANALSLLSEGAGGETAAQMLRPLKFAGFTSANIQTYFNLMESGLAKVDEESNVKIANSLWIDKGQTYASSFSTAATFYRSNPGNADFTGGKAADDVNAWIREKTGSVIPQAVSKFSPEDASAAVNAVYFKSKWRGFHFNETKTEKFKGADGVSRDVQMMHVSGAFRYSAYSNFEMIRLPFGNGAYVMDVLLPTEGYPFDKAVQELSANVYTSLNRSVVDAEITFAMPKFTQETRLDLSDVFAAMDVTDAFDPEKADFSGMYASGSHNLGSVRQSAKLEIDEEGLSASSVTLIISGGNGDPSVKRLDLTADRPFFYIVKERGSEAILLMGQKTK